MHKTVGTKFMVARFSRYLKDEHRIVKRKAEGTVRLDIDYDSLFHELGNQALKNKTGRAVAMHGIVRATVVGDVDETDATEEVA